MPAITGEWAHSERRVRVGTFREKGPSCDGLRVRGVWRVGVGAGGGGGGGVGGWVVE